MNTEESTKTTYENVKESFINEVRGKFQELETEIADRNEKITERDDFIYGDRLERSLDIPIGHDFTPVNWLRRTVEVHKNMFMNRGFEVVSTYDSNDSTSAQDQEDRGRIEIENQKSKQYAEQRMKLIKAIQEDNGGDTLWSTLAENASAVGDAAVKCYYDEEEQKYEICPIESIENLYALWSKDNFREADAFAYVYQVSRQEAISEYGADEDVEMSPAGSPLEVLSATGVTNQFSGQPMVSILEVTGKIEGWGSKNGRVKRVPVGQENDLNVLIIGQKLARVIDEPKKIPKYYILPNKRQRRRPWGMSDVSDAAIQINQTYIETLSDWRTHASKVNFQKFKAFGFGMDAQLPKPEPRTVEYLPLSEGQDIVPLQQGDANGQDFARQMDELKEQFVRETGISRVLFDDPSVTLNSNQALLTSMKPTSDIAESKKQLWGPVIIKIFKDALETIAEYQKDIKDLIATDENWTLRVMWPSVMQKEDPVYQSMLLNRFNAGTMSLQSYLEAQGDSKEEIDRLRDEMNDPITAAILSHQLPMVAQMIIQASMAELQASLQAAFPQLFPPQQPPGPQNQPGQNPNGGGAAQVGPDNQATGGVGMQPVSQPGTGATATSPQGALAQTNQNNGG